MDCKMRLFNEFLLIVWCSGYHFVREISGANLGEVWLFLDACSVPLHLQTSSAIVVCIIIHLPPTSLVLFFVQYL